MKFVSKSENLRIVLEPGLEAEKISGKRAVPGVYIKFEGGVVNVEKEEWVKMMLTHPGYDNDFFAYNPEDPSIQRIMQGRTPAEPDHTMTEVKYGHVEKSNNAGLMNKVSPEMKAALAETATTMAKQIAAEIVKEQMKPMQELLQKLSDKQDDEKVAKKSLGRPPKNPVVENLSE